MKNLIHYCGKLKAMEFNGKPFLSEGGFYCLPLKKVDEIRFMDFDKFLIDYFKNFRRLEHDGDYCELDVPWFKIRFKGENGLLTYFLIKGRDGFIEIERVNGGSLARIKCMSLEFEAKSDDRGLFEVARALSLTRIASFGKVVAMYDGEKMIFKGKSGEFRISKSESLYTAFAYTGDYIVSGFEDIALFLSDYIKGKYLMEDEVLYVKNGWFKVDDDGNLISFFVQQGGWEGFLKEMEAFDRDGVVKRGRLLVFKGFSGRKVMKASCFVEKPIKITI